MTPWFKPWSPSPLLLKESYFICSLYINKCMLVRTWCLNRTQTGYFIFKTLSHDSIWTSWIKSSILCTIYVTFIIIPAFHLCQDLLVGQCPIKFSNQKHAEFLIYSIHLDSYSISTSDSLYLTHVYQAKGKSYIYMHMIVFVCVIQRETIWRKVSVQINSQISVWNIVCCSQKYLNQYLGLIVKFTSYGPVCTEIRVLMISTFTKAMSFFQLLMDYRLFISTKALWCWVIHMNEQ